MEEHKDLHPEEAYVPKEDPEFVPGEVSEVIEEADSESFEPESEKMEEGEGQEVDTGEVRNPFVIVSRPTSTLSKGAFIASLFIFFVLGGILWANTLLGGNPGIKAANNTDTKDQTAQVALAVNNPFADISSVIQAKAAYVLDISTGKVLFQKNANDRLPLASLTKIMTTLVASEQLPESATVTVTSDDIAAEGDSGLRVGEKWRFSNLVGFTLVVSSNDGARAIAQTAGAGDQSPESMPYEEAMRNFLKLMNEKARELGLLHTTFFDPSGLDINTTLSGAYGSARDVSMLMKYVLKHKSGLLLSTSMHEADFTSLDGIVHHAVNTDVYTGKYPGLFASKTGYTDLAGGNLTVIFNAGPLRPIVITVLGSTVEGRFEDVEKLLWAALGSLDTETVSSPEGSGR